VFPDFRVQDFFVRGCFLTLVFIDVLHPDIPLLCYYVLFYIPIFHDFGTMCYFISQYSMTLVQCVVLYPDILWLCYYVLFYIPIFHDFVIMCCFISRYSMTCYYVLFYIRCVLTKIRSFDDTIHLISQLSCWLEWLIRLISFNSLSKFLFMCGVRFFQAYLLSCLVVRLSCEEMYDSSY
jgi:hypothetical protein